MEIGEDVGIKEDLLAVAQEARDEKIKEITAERDTANARYDERIQKIGEIGDREELESLLLNRSSEAWEEYNLSDGQRQLLRDLLRDNRGIGLVEILAAFEDIDTQIKAQLATVRSTEHGKGIVVTRSGEDDSWMSHQWHATVQPPEGRDEIYKSEDLTIAKKLIENPTPLELSGILSDSSGILLIDSAQVITYIESIEDKVEKSRAVLAVQSSMMGQYMQPHFQEAVDFYKDQLEDAVRSCLETDSRIVKMLADVRYHIMKIIDDERGDHEGMSRAVKHTLEKAAKDLMRSLTPVYTAISSETLEGMVTEVLTRGAIDIINTTRENLDTIGAILEVPETERVVND